MHLTNYSLRRELDDHVSYAMFVCVCRGSQLVLEQLQQLQQQRYNVVDTRVMFVVVTLMTTMMTMAPCQR